MVVYKVEFFYPDGHVEEFDDIYRTLHSAIKFGNDMLNQVAATEQYHGKLDPKKAYFIVTEVEGESSKIVHNSKK